MENGMKIPTLMTLLMRKVLLFYRLMKNKILLPLEGREHNGLILELVLGQLRSVQFSTILILLCYLELIKTQF